MGEELLENINKIISENDEDISGVWEEFRNDIERPGEDIFDELKEALIDHSNSLIQKKK